MNQDHFWKIIDRTTPAATQEEQLELFHWELDQLSVAELDAFGDIFGELFIQAYNWDLWLVAWLARRGMCSDDGFHYFRLWLISRGRTVCESALADPESIAALIAETEHPTFESFGYVMTKVRRQKTDQPPANPGVKHPKQPSGGDWLRPELKDRTGSKMLNLCVVFNELTEADFAVIEKRFPRLWALCLQKGIINSGGLAKSTRPSHLPTIQQIAATVDPNLVKTDMMAYLKAVADAARQAYKKKE